MDNSELLKKIRTWQDSNRKKSSIVRAHNKKEKERIAGQTEMNLQEKSMDNIIKDIDSFIGKEESLDKIEKMKKFKYRPSEFVEAGDEKGIRYGKAHEPRGDAKLNIPQSSEGGITFGAKKTYKERAIGKPAKRRPLMPGGAIAAETVDENHNKTIAEMLQNKTNPQKLSELSVQLGLQPDSEKESAKKYKSAYYVQKPQSGKQQHIGVEPFVVKGNFDIPQKLENEKLEKPMSDKEFANLDNPEETCQHCGYKGKDVSKKYISLRGKDLPQMLCNDAASCWDRWDVKKGIGADILGEGEPGETPQEIEKLKRAEAQVNRERLKALRQKEHANTEADEYGNKKEASDDEPHLGSGSISSLSDKEDDKEKGKVGFNLGATEKPKIKFNPPNKEELLEAIKKFEQKKVERDLKASTKDVTNLGQGIHVNLVPFKKGEYMEKNNFDTPAILNKTFQEGLRNKQLADAEAVAYPNSEKKMGVVEKTGLSMAKSLTNKIDSFISKDYSPEDIKSALAASKKNTQLAQDKKMSIPRAGKTEAEKEAMLNIKESGTKRPSAPYGGTGV